MSIEFKTYEAHAWLKSNSEINNQLSAERWIDDLLWRMNTSTRWITNPNELMAKIRWDKDLNGTFVRIDSFKDAEKEEMLSIYKKYLPS